MLKIENYSLTLNGTYGQALPVLENINLHIKKGTCLGIAGESGSGKSVMAMSIVGLIPKGSIKSSSGHIYVDGIETTNASEYDLNKIRGKDVGFVFQEPMTAMNPLMKLSEQIGEVVYAHKDSVSSKEVEKIVIRSLLLTESL